MSVAEYESRFTSLSRYAATLIVDKEEKCKMFREGLNHRIKTKIKSLHFNHYLELVHATLRAEESEQKSLSRTVGLGRARGRGTPPVGARALS